MRPCHAKYRKQSLDGCSPAMSAPSIFKVRCVELLKAKTFRSAHRWSCTWRGYGCGLPEAACLAAGGDV